MDITIVAHLKGYFYSICVWFVTGWPLSKNVSHLSICCMYFLFRNRTLLHLLVPICLNITYVVLFTVWFCLMCALAWLKSWMTLELHPDVNLEVLYIFCKFPTSIWSLVHVWKFLHYWYSCRVQTYLYGNNASFLMDLVCTFQKLHSWNYILWTFVTLI